MMDEKIINYALIDLAMYGWIVLDDLELALRVKTAAEDIGVYTTISISCTGHIKVVVDHNTTGLSQKQGGP